MNLHGPVCAHDLNSRTNLENSNMWFAPKDMHSPAWLAVNASAQMLVVRKLYIRCIAANSIHNQAVVAWSPKCDSHNPCCMTAEQYKKNKDNTCRRGKQKDGRR